MSKIGFLESKPLREKIADKIRADIIKGVYADGERLIEPKLAESLGTSRTPIREALRQLENEGFIEIVPRKGAVVKELTLKDITDLYRVKACLEGLAARQAVENMTPKDIERLKKYNEKFVELVTQNPDVREEYLKYNLDFHNVFINASKNAKLIEIVTGLDKNFQRLKTMLVSRVERASNAIQEHEAIIAAFESGSPDRVEQTVRSHIRAAAEFLTARITEETLKQQRGKPDEDEDAETV